MARTTVTLDDTLFARLRQLAVRHHQSITETLNGILAQYFRPKSRMPKFTLRWEVIAGTKPPIVDPADRDQLYDVLDEKL